MYHGGGRIHFGIGCWAEKTEIDDGPTLALAAVAAFTADAADRFVVRESAVRHSSLSSIQVVEGAAVGITAVAHATCPADGLIPRELLKVPEGERGQNRPRQRPNRNRMRLNAA
jgi:hypothetical protein